MERRANLSGKNRRGAKESNQPFQHPDLTKVMWRNENCVSVLRSLEVSWMYVPSPKVKVWSKIGIVWYTDEGEWSKKHFPISLFFLHFTIFWLGFWF